MRRYLGWAAVAAALLLYIFSSQIITLFTDLLWFRELGYRPVKLTLLRTQALLGITLGTLFFLIVYVNV